MKLNLEKYKFRAIKALKKKDYSTAEKLLKKVVASDQLDIDSMRLLGLAKSYLGKLDEAEFFLRKAIEHQPSNVRFHEEWLNFLLRFARFDEAKKYVAECNLRGLTSPRLSRLSEIAQQASAEDSISEKDAIELRSLFKARQYAAAEKKSMELIRDHPEAGYLWKMLGVCQHRLHNKQMALASLYKASKLLPDDFDVMNEIGILAINFRLYDAAEEALKKAIELQPDRAEPYSSLSVCSAERNQHVAAERYAMQAIELKPKEPLYYENLASAYSAQGRLKEAAEVYRSALNINNKNGEIYSSYLFSLLHDGSLEPDFLFSEHKKFGEIFEDKKYLASVVHNNDRNPDRRLRIGFVSGDFYSHAAAYYMLNSWPLLDRDQFDIFAYYTHTQQDAVTAKLKDMADYWCDAAQLDHKMLAEKVRHDSIDILVDYSGHTKNNRLLTVAMKPAPVQFSMLGYPYTTGLKAMDYRPISAYDPTDEGFANLFTEATPRPKRKNLVLKRTRPKKREDSPPHEVATPAIKNGFVTFATLNRITKINSDNIEAWSRILNLVPESILVFGNVSDESLKADLASQLESFGVASDRVLFLPRLPLMKYMALYRQIDVLLDTWPYSGSTTTKDALSMAVPVVTKQGFLGYQNASAYELRRMQLDFLIADSVDEYVQKAVYWATHPSELAALRDDIASLPEYKANPEAQDLSDMFVNKMFRTAWQRWCQGLAPTSFEV